MAYYSSESRGGKGRGGPHLLGDEERMLWLEGSRGDPQEALVTGGGDISR